MIANEVQAQLFSTVLPWNDLVVAPLVVPLPPRFQPRHKTFTLDY